jgi:hypothetical protein
MSGKTQRKQRRTKAEMEEIREAIVTTLEDENPMTVRQVFYRLVSQGAIDKTENDYVCTACRLLVEMRLNGTIPFDWIADNSRWQRGKAKSYSSIEQALANCVSTYRRDLWDNQDVYVEVWTEKDALAGVLLEETRNWDVPLMVSRGFSSITYLHNAAEAIHYQGKPAYLYYFGDHDPSGVLIDRDIERKLRGFAPKAEIHFQRVAVTRQQIRDLRLPTRPTKASKHSRGFRGRSVEVDAIPPRTLREMVRNCIEQHIDDNRLAALKRTEAAERESMQTFINNWPS